MTVPKISVSYCSQSKYEKHLVKLRVIINWKNERMKVAKLSWLELQVALLTQNPLRQLARFY